MWIRSQNKEILVDTHEICICAYLGNFYEIQCPDDKGYIVLGTYVSHERARKVLDEIQDCLLKHMKGFNFSPDIMHKINFVFAEPFVFQMPQDGDVGDE